MSRTSSYARIQFSLVLAAGFALLLTGCGDNGTQQPGSTSVQRLPVTTSDVMESLINHSADPLFDVSWGNPGSMEEWAAVEQMARQLQIGGSLLRVPGTGAMDGEWTSDASFANYAQQLSDAASRAVVAARSENQAELNQIGMELNAVCNGCHATFAPGLPQVNLLD